MAERPIQFNSVACSTGQHREMLDQAIASLGIRVDHDLKLMTAGQTLTAFTSRALTALGEMIDHVLPDLVIVQGDTTTTFTAALAAFYRGVPVAHVEAGLRTGDLQQPFPEEANRILTDQLSSYCFAPTQKNRENLLKEGVPSDRVFVTGNTGIDALLMVWNRASRIDPASWNGSWGHAKDAIVGNRKPIILVTAHRRESFGEPLRSVYTALKSLATRHPEWDFVYPVHLNPNVRGPCYDMLLGIQNVFLIEPLEYEPFVYLLGRSRLILTDSGGIQEEAPSLGKPVLVLREKTERREAVEIGTVVLVGTDPSRIRSKVEEIMGNQTVYDSFRKRPNPYGDGTAAEQILTILERRLNSCQMVQPDNGDLVA